MKKIPIIDSKPFELYLDLDGVFAHFDQRVFELSGKFPYQLHKNTLWKIVMADKNFFGSLDLMPDAEYLWEYSKQYNPTVLTGAPPGERSRSQKREWTGKKFGEEWSERTIVLPKRDKQLYSGPNKLLVDDTIQTIEQWASKGGLAVHHRDPWETIEKIEELRISYTVIA